MIVDGVKYKRPGGRRKTEIDLDEVRNCAKVFCTQEETASILGVSVKTFQNNKDAMFVWQSEINSAKRRLRDKQVEVALKGNPVMLKWLGVQYIGQVDRTDSTLTGTQTLVVWEDDYGQDASSVQIAPGKRGPGRPRLTDQPPLSIAQ